VFTVLLIFVLTAASLSLLFWVGSLFLQSYLYTQPSQGLYWQAPVGGILLGAFITMWCAMVLFSPSADINNITYDTIFRFNAIEDMDKVPVTELKVVPKKGDPIVYKRYSVLPPNGAMHKWEFQDSAKKKWNGRGEAVLLTSPKGDELRFTPASPGGSRFYSDKGGWYLDVDDVNGTDGRPQAFRYNLFLVNVLLNSLFLALWIGAMFLVRFLPGTAILIGVVFWLVTTLTLLPGLLNYCADASQKRRIGTVRTSFVAPLNPAKTAA
jgi:hypothetical protein